ncbi:MAG TPA: hypothetical protein VJJ21_04805 [Candidatus Nanoarchaeia archaeon]|nr:hypothetical protein [Candidatus Nanoarchaeia archaeon]
MTNPDLTKLVEEKEPTETALHLKKQGYTHTQLGEREEANNSFLLSILYHQSGSITIIETTRYPQNNQPSLNQREFQAQKKLQDYCSIKNVRLGKKREL